MLSKGWTPAGERNRRITLQTQTTAPDAYGEPQSSWTSGPRLWAKIATVSSREVYQAGQFTSQITHVINIVWSASLLLSAGMQVLYGARLYTVQAVENVQQADREYNLMCIEINGGQA
jgi:SPP1 family predicted phage head-tail adaptor